MSDPGGAQQMVTVAANLEAQVQEASEECPGECIFIESE
jgi:ferredoxin